MKKVALVALTLCALLPGAARGQNKAADAAAQQNARGAALLKDGKFEEAVAELQKAADAAPTSAVIQSNLAYAYDRQGKTEEAAHKLLGDALSLEKAGAFALVLEGIPRQLGRSITSSLSVPTIGIGAGPDTDAQVLALKRPGASEVVVPDHDSLLVAGDLVARQS